VALVGSDLAAGERPQLLIPGQTWHVSRLAAGGAYALLSTTEWPGVEPQDVEVGEPDDVAAGYPGMADQVAAFSTRGEPLRT
jgi:uncharacterized protein